MKGNAVAKAMHNGCNSLNRRKAKRMAYTLIRASRKNGVGFSSAARRKTVRASMIYCGVLLR